MYIFNPFTQYEDGYEIVERIKSWELRVITNKRLGELLECEKKIAKIDNIMNTQQYYNCITISN